MWHGLPIPPVLKMGVWLVPLHLQTGMASLPMSGNDVHCAHDHRSLFAPLWQVTCVRGFSCMEVMLVLAFVVVSMPVLCYMLYACGARYAVAFGVCCRVLWTATCLYCAVKCCRLPYACWRCMKVSLQQSALKPGARIMNRLTQLTEAQSAGWIVVVVPATTCTSTRCKGTRRVQCSWCERAA